MTPVTRQCCAVSAVAATMRAAIETTPPLLNEDRLSQALFGSASATEYFARELLALAKACAAAGAAVAHTSARTYNMRMDVPFIVIDRAPRNGRASMTRRRAFRAGDASATD